MGIVMNKIKAIITDIQSVNNINIVSFDASGYQVKMMALELQESFCIGSEVLISAKATNIAITREKIDMLSISNQLVVKIEGIKLGELLCSIHFNFAGEVWESILTRDAASKMQLKVGEMMVVLIKSSEVFIVKGY